MIAEAFDDEWTKNSGYQPVSDDVLVDVEVNGYITAGDRAGSWLWELCEDNPVAYWRLHKTKKTLEDAYDSAIGQFESPYNAAEDFFPRVKVIPPMPPCKPSKPEKTNKVGRLSDEDILLAFNKLTGSNLSVDAYEMLLSLQEMFDSRS